MTAAVIKKAKPKAAKPYSLPAGHALVLRTCSENMLAHGDFEWPKVGGVATALDWAPTNKCGKGLHGWLYGQGDHEAATHLGKTAKWLVVEVPEAGIIMFGGKCKFQSGTVRFIGAKADAAAFLIAHEPRAANVAVIGATLVVGDGMACMVGALGTATAGYRGTATAGDSGTATAGYRGTATAGAKGEIRIKYWDSKAERYRTANAYTGEDGILENVAYCLDENNKFKVVV